jgi:hypothetical protein
MSFDTNLTLYLMLTVILFIISSLLRDTLVEGYSKKGGINDELKVQIFFFIKATIASFIILTFTTGTYLDFNYFQSLELLQNRTNEVLKLFNA